MADDRRVRRILLVLGIVASTLLLLPSPARAAASTISVLQFNLCGHACGTGLVVAHDTEASILTHSPQPAVVTLEEVCRSQYADLLAALPGYGGHFAVTVTGACGGGDDYGIALLVHTSAFTYLGDWPLPRTSGEARRVACLQTSALGSYPLVACVTHITNVGADIAAQVAAVADRVEGYRPGRHVLLGGDFNTTPASAALNPLYLPSYTPTGTGHFEEADAPSARTRTGGSDGSSTNEYTSCGGQHYGCGGSYFWWATAKLDDVFLSTGDWSDYTADATSAAHSDHKPLWITTVIN